MSEPTVKPDAHGQCPPGYVWSGRLQQCVPIEPAPTTAPVTDLSQKKGMPPVMPDANGNCPEGYEYSSLMGHCVPIGTAKSAADFKVYLQLKKRHPTETQFEALRSVAILGLVLDRRFEQQGLDPVYESFFKKKRHVGDRTVTIMVETGEKLLEPAAKVAAELSARYPQFASPLEWKHRARMFQHLPVKNLQDLRESIQSTLERMKRSERYVEINRAYKHLDENLPIEALYNVDEASKHWLKAMQVLRKGNFSYYAAREVADHVSFRIDKTHSYGRYSIDEHHVNLPSTWNDESILFWREAEEKETREKEAWDAEDQENKKQRETLKPMLTKLIEQGMSDGQIKATLEAQKRPRQLIEDFMLDARVLRLQGVQKRQPPPMKFIMSSAKEDLTPDQIKKLTAMFDQDVMALFPAGLTDQEIYDRVTSRLGDFDKDGTNGPIYQVFTLKDSDLLKGRIRNLRQTYTPKWNEPTVMSKEQFDDLHRDSR